MMEAQSETKASKIMKTLAGGGEVGEGSADKREALLGMAKGPPQKKVWVSEEGAGGESRKGYRRRLRGFVVLCLQWYSLLWSGSYEVSDGCYMRVFA